MNIKKWYDNSWESGMKLSRNIMSYKRYFDILKPQNYKTHLDIGCGDGKLCHIFSSTCLSIGIDISDIAIKKAQTSFMFPVFKQTSLEDLGDDKYDYITAIGSIEHCQDIEVALLKIRKLCHDKTRLIIVVPNSNFIYWKFGKVGTDQIEIGETLKSLDEWSKLFEDHGLLVEKVYKDYGRNFAMRIAFSLIPLKYTYQFVFILGIK